MGFSLMAPSMQPSGPCRCDSVEISIDEFAAVDIRVGRIIEARAFPEARKPAFVLRVDLGALGIRTSTAQITDHYDLDDLVGRLVFAVVNLPARQVGPHRSEVLVLGASDERGVVLAVPEQDVPLGARLH